MTIAWTGFPASTTAVSGDVLVGLDGGTTNARYNAQSFLFKANNLSDLASASTARTNLELGAASTVTFLNLYAGASGTAGTLRSYSSTATSGYLSMAGAANAGNYAIVITNASHGQAATYSIPDCGGSSADFLLSKSSGTQHITLGSLQLDVGALSLGSSGNASSLTLYPATAANGTLIISPLNAGGAFNTTLRNSAMGQSSVISFPDPGAATANVLLSASAGTQTISAGSLALTAGYMLASRDNALTAHAGGGQGSALQLAKQINRVTTVATAADSVKLPAALAGRSVVVVNAAAANAMDCFPSVGEIINALSANTALSIAANKTVMFVCAVDGTWNSILTA